MGEKPRQQEEPSTISEQSSQPEPIVSEKKDWSRVSKIIEEGRAQEEQDKKDLAETRKALLEKFPEMDMSDQKKQIFDKEQKGPEFKTGITLEQRLEIENKQREEKDKRREVETQRLHKKLRGDK